MRQPSRRKTKRVRVLCPSLLCPWNHNEIRLSWTKTWLPCTQDVSTSPWCRNLAADQQQRPRRHRRHCFESQLFQERKTILLSLHVRSKSVLWILSWEAIDKMRYRPGWTWHDRAQFHGGHVVQCRVVALAFKKGTLIFFKTIITRQLTYFIFAIVMSSKTGFTSINVCCSPIGIHFSCPLVTLSCSFGQFLLYFPVTFNSN